MDFDEDISTLKSDEEVKLEEQTKRIITEGVRVFLCAYGKRTVQNENQPSN
ncbi:MULTISPECIES: hypothetical protein [unclassified Paenibacillus]|uniref:hypothetical protein n=1 Tax=unclassified Paenibacillus TaxID=185978 RepID=UPI0019F97B6E|nr:hypothetical protein [Paenibacillus sp. Y412MC10]